MLVEGKPMLRHVLLHLQNLDGNFQYEEMQQDLESFLFSNMESSVSERWKRRFAEKGYDAGKRRLLEYAQAD